MCEHREVSNFGEFLIRTDGKKRQSTLAKCDSCGEFLTLDSQVVPENAIISETKSAKENMRTVLMQINCDLYDRILDLIESEGVGGDSSMIMTELVGLGLHHYSRIHRKDLRKEITSVSTA